LLEIKTSAGESGRSGVSGPQIAMDIPKHYEKVSHGFSSVFEAGLPSVVETILPVTSDRYYESIHFAELVLSFVPNEDHIAQMNWYFSASFRSIYRHIRCGEIRSRAGALSCKVQRYRSL